MNSKEMRAVFLWSSDPETRRSTSAGAFYLIAREFLNTYGENAVVYGCAWDENVVARHVRVNSCEELNQLQGSKYVQSNTVGVYKSLLGDLKNGAYVLFSGTACQTAAAIKTAGSLVKRLYTIDILCHGVPSPKFWANYIEYLGRRSPDGIHDVSFRNKSATNRMGYLLMYRNGERTKRVFPNESIYYNAFIESYSLRPSCYKCPFIGQYEWADITLADSNYKGFHPNEAISLLIIRTDKGVDLLDSVRDMCEVVEGSTEVDSAYNKKLTRQTERPDERDLFYQYVYDNMLMKVPIKVKLSNRIKSIVPTSLKNAVRKK